MSYFQVQTSDIKLVENKEREYKNVEMENLIQEIAKIGEKEAYLKEELVRKKEEKEN